MRARNPMPQDVLELLESRGLRADYDQRPAYQRNDYLGWIDRAKLPATRERRIAQMLDELACGGVYMGMEHRPSRKEKDATSSGGAEVGGPEAPDVVAGPRTADEYLEAQPAERRLSCWTSSGRLSLTLSQGPRRPSRGRCPAIGWTGSCFCTSRATRAMSESTRERPLSTTSPKSLARAAARRGRCAWSMTSRSQGDSSRASVSGWLGNRTSAPKNCAR